jgi:hypothetical protein
VIDAENIKAINIGRTPLGPLAVEHGFTTEFEASILRHKLVQEKRKYITSLTIDIQHLEWHRAQVLARLHSGSVDAEKRQFVRACPYAGCRGFLSTVWKCGMCDNWTCPTCHEGRGPDKDAPHVCDPNNVATAELLAKDSRNCPKCASLIFKINGCDQMYCTQCHTAFSWRTLRVETGTVHNPHYYEYQRANGTLQRNPGDVPCGGFPDWGVISRILTRAFPNWQLIANAHRAHGHCQWAVIPRYNVGIEDNRDLRIKLMIGDFGEDDFKRKIQQREKARQRKTEIRQILEMFLAVLNDLFQGFAISKDPAETYSALLGLASHVNSTMALVSKRYSNCSTPRISPDFNIT